jgi:hypothetical protein
MLGLRGLRDGEGCEQNHGSETAARDWIMIPHGYLQWRLDADPGWRVSFESEFVVSSSEFLERHDNWRKGNRAEKRFAVAP